MSDTQEVVSPSIATWEPVGTIQFYNLDEVLEVLQRNVPIRLRPIVKLIERRGFGQHKLRHFQTYQCVVEQPAPGKKRGNEVVAGRDGRVTLNFTTGPTGNTTSASYSYLLPRRYSSGGE